VENYAEKYYVHMIKDIQEEQARYELFIRRELPEMERQALVLLTEKKSGRPHEDAADYMADVTKRISQDVIHTWWRLFDFLLGKYKDGTSVDALHMETYNPTRLFYPEWWLELVGFWPDTHATLVHLDASSSSAPAPASAMPSPSPVSTSSTPAEAALSSGNFSSTTTLVLVAILSGVFGYLLGIYMGNKRAYGYEPIPGPGSSSSSSSSGGSGARSGSSGNHSHSHRRSNDE
jgi:hypothetical protein